MSGDSNQLWQQCVGQLMAEGQCADCAVVRLRGGEVLAAAPGGALQHLSPREVRLLLDTSRDNRRRLQTHGLSLGGVPVAVLRDQLTAAGGAVVQSTAISTVSTATGGGGGGLTGGGSSSVAGGGSPGAGAGSESAAGGSGGSRGAGGGGGGSRGVVGGGGSRGVVGGGGGPSPSGPHTTVQQLSMDLRTKRQPSQGVAVYRTRTHLLLLMGRHGVGGGLLHHRAHQMAVNLHHAGA